MLDIVQHSKLSKVLLQSQILRFVLISFKLLKHLSTAAVLT